MKAFTPITAVLSAVAGIFLSGCATTIINQTPERVPQNPSNIYTLTMMVDMDNPNLDKESLRANAVINGQTIPMQPAAPGSNVYAADVELPPEQAQAVFYFEIFYDVRTSEGTVSRERKSNLYQFSLANRYIVQLETTRAPVGSTVPVLGRGFTRSDQIVVGGQIADTRFVSENVLEFVVPPLEAGVSYPVVWQSGLGNQTIGNFRIDGSRLIVRPDRLVVRSGDRRVLVFQIDFDAPRGGLIINDTTDIPQSIIMPEVVIPAGARSVSIPVEGAEPGVGNLYFSVGGMNEVTVPVTVTEF